MIRGDSIYSGSFVGAFSISSLRTMMNNIKGVGAEIPSCGRCSVGDCVVSSAQFKSLCDKYLNKVTIGYRVEMIKNKIFITSWPSQAHERVCAKVDACIMSINASMDFPYTSMRSTRWSFGEDGCVEGDSAFVNEWIVPAMRQRDANGDQLPDIVVEVSKSQRYEDIFERPFIFFSDTYPGVKAMVLIKLVGSAPFNQLIAVVYRRNANGMPQATSAISFGRYLHPQTMNAILEHSHIAPHLFVGTGRHGMDEQCSVEGIAMFNLHILSAASAWKHVPVDRIPPPIIQRDVTIDLFFIRNVLTRAGLAT